jgi:hypothetical protein
VVLAHASGCNVDIRYPVGAPSPSSAGSPSIVSDGDQIEFAHSKATPFATERQAAWATATVLEGCDNRCAGLVFADCSGAKDPDIAVIQCACALTIHDGLANDLVSHRRIPFRSFEDTLCSLCGGHNFNRRMEIFSRMVATFVRAYAFEDDQFDRKGSRSGFPGTLLKSDAKSFAAIRAIELTAWTCNLVPALMESYLAGAMVTLEYPAFRSSFARRCASSNVAQFSPWNSRLSGWIADTE